MSGVKKMDCLSCSVGRQASVQERRVCAVETRPSMGKRQSTRYTQMGITSKKTKTRDTYSARSMFYPVTLLLTI